MTKMIPQIPLPNTVCIGIDWADQLHAFHLTGFDGKPFAGTVKQDPAQIRDLFEIWREQFPNSTFAVAIEQSRGPLINVLLGYHDVAIYPVNPAALANYRKAFAHGGGKNDPVDAQLLCQYLQHYRDQRKRPGKPSLPGSLVLRPVNSGLWTFSGEVRYERTGAGLA